MANKIVPFESRNHDNSGSPFDAIRRFEQDGNEYWTARDLMIVLGYRKYERIEDAVDRAKLSCKNAGNPCQEHFIPTSGSSGGRPREDYKLTRYACYLVAMNGDPRKPEVASAQVYFAAKTREAETVIPAQSDRIRELELENENLKLRERLLDRQDAMMSIHGRETVLVLMGKSDQIVETEKPTIETFAGHEKQFSGQTTKQIADYLQKRHGIRVKSGTEVSRALTRAGRADLITRFDRPVRVDGVSREHLDEAYRILTSGDRQKLIGE